jgi:hypothetical protein
MYLSTLISIQVSEFLREVACKFHMKQTPEDVYGGVIYKDPCPTIAPSGNEALHLSARQLRDILKAVREPSNTEFLEDLVHWPFRNVCPAQLLIMGFK